MFEVRDKCSREERHEYRKKKGDFLHKEKVSPFHVQDSRRLDALENLTGSDSSSTWKETEREGSERKTREE